MTQDTQVAADPRCLRAALVIAAFYAREHDVQIDDFDVERVATAIEASVGVRRLEVAIMNARADLGRVVEDLRTAGGAT